MIGLGVLVSLKQPGDAAYHWRWALELRQTNCSQRLCEQTSEPFRLTDGVLLRTPFGARPLGCAEAEQADGQPLLHPIRRPTAFESVFNAVTIFWNVVGDC